jgi:hypothetical protein
MRLSKSPAVSLEGDRITTLLLRKTVAQLPAEQSLTILTELGAVKAFYASMITR